MSTCALASTRCSTAHTGWGRCAGQPAVIIHLVGVGGWGRLGLGGLGLGGIGLGLG